MSPLGLRHQNSHLGSPLRVLLEERLLRQEERLLRRMGLHRKGRLSSSRLRVRLVLLILRVHLAATALLQGTQDQVGTRLLVEATGLRVPTRLQVAIRIWVPTLLLDREAIRRLDLIHRQGGIPRLGTQAILRQLAMATRLQGMADTHHLADTATRRPLATGLLLEDMGLLAMGRRLDTVAVGIVAAAEAVVQGVTTGNSSICASRVVHKDTCQRIAQTKGNRVSERCAETIEEVIALVVTVVSFRMAVTSSRTSWRRREGVV